MSAGASFSFRLDYRGGRDKHSRNIPNTRPKIIVKQKQQKSELKNKKNMFFSPNKLILRYT